MFADFYLKIRPKFIWFCQINATNMLEFNKICPKKPVIEENWLHNAKARWSLSENVSRFVNKNCQKTKIFQKFAQKICPATHLTL